VLWLILLNLWYCVDDTLARVLGIPGLGDVPLWVVNLPWLVFGLLPIVVVLIVAALANMRIR